MKKIFFLTGVALCALTLATSCVKDNESASVTSLRNAKTEQIKAAAELAKAQAAAATLTAQADANLKNAQAELAKAQAEYQKAYAEYENAQAEKAKAEAEKAKVEAQQKIQELLNQIEKDKIQFEYDMAKLVADLEKKTAQIGKDKADDAIAELNTAATNYKTAVDNLIDGQKKLNEKKVELAKAEIGQADWESTKAKDIAEYKHWIAQNQAEIEMYKQYANYTEDVQALKDKYNALCNKFSILSDNYEAALNGYNTPVESTAEDAAKKKLEENPFWKMFYTSDHNITLSDGKTKISFTNTLAFSWIAFDYATTETMKKVIATYTDKAGNEIPYPVPIGIDKVINKATVNIDGINCKIEEVSADVINMKIKEDKAAYAKKKKDLDNELKALNDELKPLKETAAAKLKALNAIEVGADGYEAAKTAYETAVLAVNSKQGKIDDKNEDIKTAAEYSEAYDIIADFVVKYADNCKAVDALYDEVLEGKASDYAENAKYWLEYKKLDDEKSEVNSEINAMYVVLYNYNPVYGSTYPLSPYGASVLAGWIESCEKAIKEYQRYIDNYELDLDPNNAHGSSKEQAIETAKKNIALQEEYIKSLEIIANQRKAEYEAVLAKYQNAE